MTARVPDHVRTVLPKAVYGRNPPGHCRFPRCRNKAMTTPTASSIRCEKHKKLCARCWKEDYDPATGYCPTCNAEMLANIPKFTAPSHLPAPGGPGIRDREILGVLSEFCPDWERDL